MAYKGRGIIATRRIEYGGATILDYHNTHGGVSRDDVIDAVLPENVGACSIMRSIDGDAAPGTCIRRDLFKAIVEHFGDLSMNAEQLRRKLKCTDDKCVLTTAARANIISSETAQIEEQVAFKQRGPTDTTLFNDSVIESILYAWMHAFDDFFAYNFNMLDWREKSIRNGVVVNRPDTLATINWRDIIDGRVPAPIGMSRARAKLLLDRRGGPRAVRYGACIINSDIYDGRGKHWMALFVDTRDDANWTIEFFNSAAVRPESEWIDWMMKTKSELIESRRTLGLPESGVSCIYVCRVWHQHTRTECGPYSLFYIWSRIHGVGADYFMENAIPDQIIFEFRQHLFAESRGGGKPFDFDKYARSVSIKWDVENLRDGVRTNM